MYVCSVHLFICEYIHWHLGTIQNQVTMVAQHNEITHKDDKKITRATMVTCGSILRYRKNQSRMMWSNRDFRLRCFQLLLGESVWIEERLETLPQSKCFKPAGCLNLRTGEGNPQDWNVQMKNFLHQTAYLNASQSKQILRMLYFIPLCTWNGVWEQHIEPIHRPLCSNIYKSWMFMSM